MAVDIRLLPKQFEFLSCQDREAIFMGGIGSGKTFCGVVWDASRALQKRHVLVVEPTFSMCEDVLLPTFRDVFTIMGMKEKTHYTINKSKLNIDLCNGGSIRLRSADRPDRMRGPNLHDGHIDEFGQLSDDEAYKVVLGRLRLDEKAQLKLTGTPTPIKWVRDLATSGVKLIRQATTENWHLPKAYIDSLKDRYGEGTPWYRQEILGELVDFSTGLIEASKMVVIGTVHPFLPRVVRAWDFAHADKKSSDFTASVLMSTDGKRYIIHDVTHFKGQYSAVRDRIIQTMLTDPYNCTQWIENTMGGMVVRSELMTDARLHSVSISPVNAVGDKVSRVLPVASRIAQGMMSICQQHWNRSFIDELNAFGGKTEHDDQVDALAHAYNCLAQNGEMKTFTINI